ncbi:MULTISPECIES: hypothetical protein [unclassified Streptomyces]|uniref:hypothetical protein n=1 Tax=unclassified Streptomyces TaxID=2593676 RepID=UPI000AA99FD1|nr:hypothetical protein [Streptomyces sp. CNQ-509]
MAPEQDGQRPAVGVAELLAACAAAEAVSTPPAPEPEAAGTDGRRAGRRAPEGPAEPEQHAA